jgi:hypothetical protein
MPTRVKCVSELRTSSQSTAFTDMMASWQDSSTSTFTMKMPRGVVSRGALLGWVNNYSAFRISHM